MSSVGASDRKSNDERIRKTREEYESKEAENQKKQKAEMELLNHKHHEELSRLSDDFDRQIDELKDQFRSSMSDRDQNNTRKVDEVRNLYREQLRKKSEENEGDRREMRRVSTGALAKQKSIAEMQKENLLENHREELTQSQAKFQEMNARNRDEMKGSLSHHDQLLKESHEKELGATIKDRDIQVGNKDRDNKEMRKAYESKIANERRQKESEVARWNQKFQDTVLNNNEEKSDTMKTQGMILKGELAELNRKYDNAINKKYEQLDNAGEELRESVNDRLNSQVRSKQSQIERLSGKLNHQMINDERLRNIERRDLESKYVEQMDLLEKQKEGAVEQMKETNKKRIGKVLSDTDKTLRTTFREQKGEMELKTQRNHQDREMLIQQHKDNVDLISGTAENRVRKITKVARENQDAYANYFDKSLDQMKDTFSERVDAQREKGTDDLVRMNKALGDRFHGIEKNHALKLEAITGTYDAKVGQMKEAHEKELKRIENYYSQRLANRDKETKQQTGSLEMKYEAKIAQMNETHQDQLDRMNRRHQEDMQNLATKVSNYSKKA
jgi:hypothetical protein